MTGPHYGLALRTMTGPHYGHPLRTMMGPHYRLPLRTMTGPHYGLALRTMTGPHYGLPLRTMMGPHYRLPLRAMTGPHYGLALRTMTGPHYGLPLRTMMGPHYRLPLRAMTGPHYGLALRTMMGPHYRLPLRAMTGPHYGMEGVFFLLALVVCVHGTSHLSFSNDTSEVDVTFSDCGVPKSCRAIPAGCDPAGQSACLFASGRRPVPPPPVGFEVTIELRGDSAGYIALGFADTRGEGNVALFVCASNNGTFFFRTLQGNNTPNAPLTPTETMVKEIRGTVNGTVIKCKFNIDLLNAAQSGSSQVTIITILLRTGTVNGDAVGAFSTTRNIGTVNLTNIAPETTTMMPTTMTSITTMMPTTMTSSTTMMPTTMTSPTTDGGGAVRPHAALLLLSVLTLSVLMRG
ncbi:uncharacterized protein LOC130190878 [Pseudoliparis swirei]|uniref:uncharacterized protein LOC130190878 n=1 Tax=Pseudoliparis swirei TaxID=2059687 RepID=UPI0024BE448D|nr:uncharacterized protein LOC130190878 [Pseudoliparis swirei]